MDWRNREHFEGLAAEMMRRVLVDHARGHKRDKRGGGLKLALVEADLVVEAEGEYLVALDEACGGEFLSAACRGDEVVMAEVSSLLASLDHYKDFLVRPALQRSASHVADSILSDEGSEISAGPSIKGYVLVREIGRQFLRQNASSS